MLTMCCGRTSGIKSMLSMKLFPDDLPELEWVEFPAEGFSSPVCGVIHSTAHPAVCGMPLGGIDTGYIDIGTDGTFGFCTIFNSHVPRRGPLNLPFLGLSLRKEMQVQGQPVPGSGNWSESWVLTSRQITGYQICASWAMDFRQAKNAREIHYWGHYPVVDMEYEIDAPVSVGLRAWTPFIPGDVAVSNTPGAIFEVHLRNTGGSEQNGSLAFSFPGPSFQEVCGYGNFTRRKIKGIFSGVVVTNRNNAAYALGVIDEKNVRTGGELGMDGGAWSRIWRRLPPEVNQPGASVAVDFKLKAGEEKIIRFILAWYSPVWRSGGTPAVGGRAFTEMYKSFFFLPACPSGIRDNAFTHMYASRYKNVLEVANLLAKQHRSILKRILAWQGVIYTEKKFPVWLRESLVNVLHLITRDSFWAQARPPIGKWCRKKDGLFGMNECPSGCPQIECIPCSFYGNIPLVYFFPELALSTLRGYKGYQYPDGQAPWIFGGITSSPPTPPCEMAMPTRGLAPQAKPQVALDGPCYVDMVDRFYMRTDNLKFLKEFYASVKKNTIFTMNLRPGSGPAGIISMPAGNYGQDWFESVELFGMVSHIGGVHLANLRMTERMAERMGDKEFARQCQEWFIQGSKEMEKYMWTGKYYLLYNEPETGKISDVIMGYQLDGEWMAKFHGLKSVFRKDRIKTTLDTLKKTVVCKRGAITFKLKKKGEFNTGYWTSDGIHIPGSLMLAMTYMYHGQRKLGLELARRTMHGLIIENRRSWDSAIIILGNTGKTHWGSDYYQNLMLWALPAALMGQDFSGPVKKGGLVNRIIMAASGNRGRKKDRKT